MPSGPITKRHGDPNPMNIPTFQSIFEGKDDEGFVEKSMTITRYSSLATGFCSLFDILLLPRDTTGIPMALSRIKYWGIPLIGGGITYTAAVNVAAGLRGKTDQTNHVLGGYAVGALIGKHSKSLSAGFIMGSFIAILGLFAKDSVMHNYGFFQDVYQNPKRGGPFYHQWDLTTRENRQGYWVRKEEDVPKMWQRGQV